MSDPDARLDLQHIPYYAELDGVFPKEASSSAVDVDDLHLCKKCESWLPASLTAAT